MQVDRWLLSKWLTRRMLHTRAESIVTPRTVDDAVAARYDPGLMWAMRVRLGADAALFVAAS